ncbi:MAG: ABC transporter permease subunit [Treponema sp.]|jgi:NitT/TauT family transport system permease protein|nr:ABC transporter permease subunit [Treponema sp.]
MKKNTAVYTIAGIIFLLFFWEAASLLRGSELLLPGPVPVLRKFIGLAATGRFLVSLWESFFRVLLGMLISVPLGVIAGIIAGLDRRAGAVLKPVFQVISATPVMAVILIAFLWFGQERTPVFTAFLMIFPVIAANTIAGIGAIDPKLKELFSVYRISRKERLFSLYIPGIAPFVLSGVRSGLSLCWKVVVAAEVLVQPYRALGTGMQAARAQLETAELFAWTVGTVIAAGLSQAILSLVLRRMQRRR